MAPNQPFFSRRQLNLIIAATAIVIALLSIPTESWPTIERQSLQPSALPPVALTHIADQHSPLQLRLLFALPHTGLLPDQTSQLLMQLLEPRLLNATPPINPRLHSDRLSLSITADSIDQLSQPLSGLSTVLLQPFDPAQIDKAIKQRRAQLHINRNQLTPVQQADHRLRWPSVTRAKPMSSTNLSTRFNTRFNTTATDINQLQQQLFSRTQLRISLIGATPEPLIESLQSLLNQLPAGQTWPTIQHQNPTMAPFDTQNTVPVLQPLAGRQSNQFPQTLLLSRLLQQLTSDTTIRLQPGASQSWLLWIPRNRPIQPNWLTTATAQARQRLATMEEWELERAADQLRQQLEQRLERPEAIADQLEVIAFYQLPVDYLAQFEATIAALTGAQIRQQLLRLLQFEPLDDAATSAKIAQ